MTYLLLYFLDVQIKVISIISFIDRGSYVQVHIIIKKLLITFNTKYLFFCNKVLFFGYLLTNFLALFVFISKHTLSSTLTISALTDLLMQMLKFLHTAII